MKVDMESNKWQVADTTVYRLFTDKDSDRCNEFTIQTSCNKERNVEETKELANKIAMLLNQEKLK